MTCCNFGLLSLLHQQNYYGDVLKVSSDLNTNVCMTPAQPAPAFVRQALKKVHHEVSDKSVGCV